MAGASTAGAVRDGPPVPLVSGRPRHRPRGGRDRRRPLLAAVTTVIAGPGHAAAAMPAGSGVAERAARLEALSDFGLRPRSAAFMACRRSPWPRSSGRQYATATNGTSDAPAIRADQLSTARVAFAANWQRPRGRADQLEAPAGCRGPLRLTLRRLGLQAVPQPELVLSPGPEGGPRKCCGARTTSSRW